MSASTGHRAARKVPSGYRWCAPTSRSSAIAVYLCRAQSDDGAVDNGLVAGAPRSDAEFPIWRALALGDHE